MEQQRLTAEERANLVAYLDGELTEDEARVLASKLTYSVSGRRELESLEKTWELLDQLPRARVSEDFATRTVAQVTQAASPDERVVNQIRRIALVAARIALAGAIAVGLGLISYFAVLRLWPDPTARLVRELSLAEHLEAYRDVGSFEFLKQLDESPDFADPPHEAGR